MVRVEHQDLGPELSSQVSALKSEIDQGIRRLLRRGIVDGSIEPCDERIAAFAIAGALNWIAHWYREGQSMGAEAVADAYVAFLENALKPRGTSPTRAGRSTAGRVTDFELASAGHPFRSTRRTRRKPVMGARPRRPSRGRVRHGRSERCPLPLSDPHPRVARLSRKRERPVCGRGGDDLSCAAKTSRRTLPRPKKDQDPNPRLPRGARHARSTRHRGRTTHADRRLPGRVLVRCRPRNSVPSRPVPRSRTPAWRPMRSTKSSSAACCRPASARPRRARPRSAPASRLRVPATTVNKMCGSGMKAVMLAADQIRAGSARVMLAGGLESMTNAPYLMLKARAGYRMGHAEIYDHMFYDGLQSPWDGKAMGCFADVTAVKYGFTREAQDAFAAESVRRALRAVEGRRLRRRDRARSR